MVQHIPRHLIVHETKVAQKVSYMRGWTGDQETQYLMKYEWKEGEWEKHKTIIERFEAQIQP